MRRQKYENDLLRYIEILANEVLCTVVISVVKMYIKVPRSICYISAKPKADVLIQKKGGISSRQIKYHMSLQCSPFK